MNLYVQLWLTLQRAESPLQVSSSQIPASLFKTCKELGTPEPTQIHRAHHLFD